MVVGAQTTNADIRLMSALDAGPKAAEAARESDLGLLWSREEVGYFGLSLELGLIEFIFLFLSETVRKGSQ